MTMPRYITIYKSQFKTNEDEYPGSAWEEILTDLNVPSHLWEEIDSIDCQLENVSSTDVPDLYAEKD